MEDTLATNKADYEGKASLLSARAPPVPRSRAGDAELPDGCREPSPAAAWLAVVPAAISAHAASHAAQPGSAPQPLASAASTQQSVSAVLLLCTTSHGDLLASHLCCTNVLKHAASDSRH